MTKVKNWLVEPTSPRIGMSNFGQYLFIGFLGYFGMIGAQLDGSSTLSWFIPAYAFYGVYILDYAPRQKLIAQTLLAGSEELRALREELRLVKGGAGGTGELRAVQEEVRRLKWRGREWEGRMRM
jgi:hypothetical protein